MSKRTEAASKTVLLSTYVLPSKAKDTGLLLSREPRSPLETNRSRVFVLEYYQAVPSPKALPITKIALAMIFSRSSLLLLGLLVIAVGSADRGNSWDVRSELKKASNAVSDSLITKMESETASHKLAAKASAACQTRIEIVFVVFDNWGSAKLRGHLMNEALTGLNLTYAHSRLVQASEIESMSKSSVDVWIFVKHCRLNVAKVCKKHSPKSFIFLDILDNYNDDDLPATGPMVDLLEGSTIAGADYILVQSTIPNAKQPTRVWYHQHTNAGPWEVKRAADILPTGTTRK